MGDDACFLDSTCLSCGRFVERVEVDGPPVCPHCGSELDGAPPPPITAVARVNTILYCSRWAETVDFYRERLGLSVRFANDWFVEFDLGDRASVSIADASRATIDAVGGQGITLSLQVRDLPATRHRLQARGAAPTAIGRRFGSEVFDVHDPEGHRIELWAE